MVRRAGQGTGPEWMLAWSGEQGRVPGQSDVGMVRKPLTLRAGKGSCVRVPNLFGCPDG